MRKLYYIITMLLFCAVAQAQERDDTCDPIDSLFFEATEMNIALTWAMNDTALAYNYRFRIVGDTMWTSLATLDTFFSIEEMNECVEYEIGISTVCPFDTSGYTLDTVLSYCPSAISFSPVNREDISIYPVPFNEFLNIVPQDESLQVLELVVRNIKGELVERQSQTQSAQLNTSAWPSGIYLLELHTDRGQFFEKIMKY